MILEKYSRMLDERMADLKAAVPSLKDCKLYFAGGCFASLVRQEKVADYDVFFVDPAEALEFMKGFVDKAAPSGLTRFGIPDCCIVGEPPTLRIKGAVWQNPEIRSAKYGKTTVLRCVSEMAATYKVRGSLYQTVFMLSGPSYEVCKSFDFEHARCAYHPRNHGTSGDFLVGPRFFESVASNELVYRSGDAKYPLGTLIRMADRVKRGWHVNDVEWVKVAFDISSLMLRDPKVMAAQLKGVDVIILNQLVDKLKDRTETITFEWFMEQLKEMKLL